MRRFKLIKSKFLIDLGFDGSIELNLVFFRYFSVGFVLRGKILVNAGFVTLDLNFNVEKEPKLNLNTDVDFSSENILCMQLSQPNDILR